VELAPAGLLPAGLVPVELGLVELGLVELGLVELGPVELGPVALGVQAAPRPERVVGELVARLAPQPGLVVAAALAERRGIPEAAAAVAEPAPAESQGIPGAAAVAAAGLAAGYRRSTKSRTDAEISLR